MFQINFFLFPTCSVRLLFVCVVTYEANENSAPRSLDLMTKQCYYVIYVIKQCSKVRDKAENKACATHLRIFGEYPSSIICIYPLEMRKQVFVLHSRGLPDTFVQT